MYLENNLILNIGALTLKINQFKFRPWETETFKFFDIFSTTLNTVQIEINNKTNIIFRIIPLFSFLLLEFITNKIRFFFDFYLTQKVIIPYVNVNNFFKPISIFNSIKLIKNNIFKLNNILINLNNSSTSIEDCFKINNFVKLYNFNLITTYNTNLNTNYINYTLNYLNLIKTNYIFLNVNIRYYSSILFLLFKKFNKKYNLINFYFVGTKYTNSILIKLIGTDLNLILKKYLFAKLKFKNLFNKFNLNFFKLSTGFNFNLNKFKLFNLSFLLNLAGQNSINYFNLKNNITNFNNSTLFNIDADTLNYNNFNFNYIINFNFNLILNNYLKTNLVIPTKTIFEKSFNYITSTKLFNFTKFYFKFNLFNLNLIKTTLFNLSPVLYSFKNTILFNFVQSFNFFLIFYYFYLTNNYTFSSKNLILGHKNNFKFLKKNNF